MVFEEGVRKYGTKFISTSNSDESDSNSLSSLNRRRVNIDVRGKVLTNSNIQSKLKVKNAFQSPVKLFFNRLEKYLSVFIAAFAMFDQEYIVLDHPALHVEIALDDFTHLVLLGVLQFHFNNP